MENRSHALAAGLFAIVLGTALIASLWWFSDDSDSQRTYILESSGNVTGLNLEARVRYRGIPAGKVSDITIDPDDPRKILVVIRLRNDIPLTRGTRATLAYQGVTGLAYVQLNDRGEDPAPLVGEGEEPPRLKLDPGTMERLTDTALDAARQLKHVADKLGELATDENIRRIGSTLQRLESVAAGADRTFADAPRTLASIRAALNRENLARLSNTVQNLERASADAGPAIGELKALMARLQGLAERVDAATGATGERLTDETLPQLEALLKELKGTSQRIGLLAAEVDASPQMLLLGRPPAPPGPGEPGFEETAHPAK
ncbi:MlaD family protein [Azoarcus sp. DN11]|uniref:MlaD family protein n=1 Tax=Azoarcus sp. DN11 TaxID=356837 RepID=UPI000EAF80C9|nr:MlaD family protein [Azoarcus sp. DN11]AYH44251.1 organic solvent ABC transporter substrate-binding protein [Azoarcus sp. DN11]